jgi:hypothetical protein
MREDFPTVPLDRMEKQCETRLRIPRQFPSIVAALRRRGRFGALTAGLQLRQVIANDEFIYNQ